MCYLLRWTFPLKFKVVIYLTYPINLDLFSSFKVFYWVLYFFCVCVVFYYHKYYVYFLYLKLWNTLHCTNSVINHLTWNATIVGSIKTRGNELFSFPCNKTNHSVEYQHISRNVLNVRWKGCLTVSNGCPTLSCYMRENAWSSRKK